MNYMELCPSTEMTSIVLAVSLARRSECLKLILNLKNDFLGPIYVCFDISHDEIDLK